MNDESPDIPGDTNAPSPQNDVTPNGEPAADDATSSNPETPREPGPRVFGKLAFWIVVFPFIFYLVGMMVGGYINNLREMEITGELDHPHHDEGNRPPKEEIDINDIEVDPDARFLFGLLPLGENSYPYTYTFVILGTTVLMLLFGWGYFRAPFRISPMSVVVGVVGVVVWIGLAYINRPFIGLGPTDGREAFNPFEVLKDTPQWMWQFMAIRFFGLVVVVPIVEEFFVRGFLIRYVDDPDWDEQPLGQASWKGWLSPTIYGVVAHMTEPFAALVWFSMVSWLYKKTGNIWDCVVAHAVTNLLLGLYVVRFDQWHLW